MSNRLRQLKRKGQIEQRKELSYQDYLAKRKARVQIKKDSEMRDQFTDRVSAIVDNRVPAWCHSVAVFCLPPKWYSTTIQWILNLIYNQRHKQRLSAALMSKEIIPTLLARWMIGSFIYAITFKWLLWLKGRFDTLGAGTRIKKLPGGKLNIKITYWFRVVDEMEIGE